MDLPGMRRFVDCENGDICLRENEEILLALPVVELYFSQEEGSIGNFLLRVTSQRVVFLGDDTSYEFDVPFIALHAISKDPNGFKKPCLYCQLDQEEGEVPDELFIVPPEESLLKDVFDAFSKAAALNPDPIEPGEQEGDDELIYDIDEVTLGAEQARNLAHLESVFQEPSFGDALFKDIEENVEEDKEAPLRKKNC